MLKMRSERFKRSIMGKLFHSFGVTTTKSMITIMITGNMRGSGALHIADGLVCWTLIYEMESINFLPCMPLFPSPPHSPFSLIFWSVCTFHSHKCSFLFSLHLFITEPGYVGCYPTGETVQPAFSEASSSISTVDECL